MRKMKRIAGAAAATVIALSMVTAMSAVTVSATPATTTYNITVNTDDPHTYKYYQIITGTFSNGLMLDEGATLGTGVNGEAFYAALGLTGSEKTPAKALDVLEAKSAADVAAALKGEGVLSGNGTDLNKGTNAVAPGYYYIVESDGTNPGDILRVADENITISPKFGTPAVEKKILEDDRTASTGSDVGVTYDSKWNDAADYSIGEMVPFKITGTIPANFASYTAYYYKFTDTLGVGYVAPNVSDIIVKIDGTIVDSDSYNVEITGENKHTITIEFMNIKNASDGVNPIAVTANSKVTVEYSAKLDTDAIIGNMGNTNGVDLTYSTDTTYDGTGTTAPTTGTDTTEDDGVVCFTYTLATNKVDGKTSTTNLAGAEFKLLNADKNKAAVVTNGKFEKWADDVEGGTVLTSAETTGLFSVVGLDSGTYYLTEIKAPNGYNKLTEDIKVEVTANMNSNGTWTYVEDDGSTAFTSLGVTYGTASGTADASTGVATGTVANNKGAELPETGGIGTTIFYVGGGAAVLASGVLLVTKRRMKKNEQ